MDPIVTPIAVKLGSVILGKGLSFILEDLFPDKNINELKDGVNVLRSKEFHSAANWLKQASFRADKDECIKQAERNAQSALYSLNEIKLKVQAYSICILTGYYNGSLGGKNLKSGKATAIAYLDDLKSEISKHFKGLSADNIRFIQEKKGKFSSDMLTGLPYAVALALLTASIIGVYKPKHEIFDSKFLQDRIYCDKMIAELEDAIARLPEH